jgi:hypothetical protein
MGRDDGETAQERTEQLIRTVDAIKNLSFQKERFLCTETNIS